MSFEIDTAYVNAYRANVEVQFQQMTSRLRGRVREETQAAEFEFYDRITPTAAQEVKTRHGDTPLISTPHDRRRVGLRDFDWADLIDKKDRIRLLADPTSAYTVNAVAALKRSMEDVLIEAAFGSAWTGKQGTTEVTLPAASILASTYVESGAATASNMTLGKLRRARYLFGKSEVGMDEPADLFIMIDPSQLHAMLRIPELTSSDYAAIKALVHGEIDTYMGFQFVQSNRLPVASNIRDCLVWEKQGILLAIGQEISVDVGVRRDKRNAQQIYVCGSFGGSRMWEEKVLKLQCDETKL